METAMDRTAAGTPPYPELRRRHIGELRGHLQEHDARLDWRRERIEEERRLRLRDLLRVARERSAFHRARLAGVDVGRFEVTDLASLPVMTKQDVMRSFDAIVTDPRLTLERVERHLAGLGDGPRYLLGEYQAVASSGSSGVRGVFAFGWDAWRTCYQGWIRYVARAMGRGPFRVAVIAAGRPVHVSYAINASFSDPEGYSYRPFPVTAPVEELVAGLNAFQPEAIGGYPSGLAALVEPARRGRLRIAPQHVVSVGEPLLPETRAALAATWGAPVVNWWICSEGGALAIGCGAGDGMHLSEDLVIVEPVDAQRRPVAPGARSAGILLTNLFNPTFPLIRYEISDEVTLLDAPCPCGSAYRRVADVQGRVDERFRYGDTAVHPHLFRSVLATERAVVEYQVRQTPRGAEVVAVGADVDAAGIARRLEAALGRLGVGAPEVTVRTVERLERGESGKLARFVALREVR